MARTRTPQAQALANLGLRHLLRCHYAGNRRRNRLVASQAQLAAKGRTLTSSPRQRYFAGED
jgi:hypothetical protein